jgi:uncharacterized protein
MLKVVSNTTPLLALMKINKLEILREVYGAIHIPYAVYKEIEKGKAKDFYIDLKSHEWIHIGFIKDEIARRYFSDLDEGEAETIMLASELKADLVLLDEIMGRRHAKKMSLTVTGTIGVLIKAKEMKLISAVHPLLLQMKDKGIWISDKLLDEVKSRVAE